MADSRKFLMVASFLVLLILISGFSCSLKNLGSSTKKDTKKTVEDLRTGTDGIVANFLPNNPPPIVHAEDNLPNAVDVILELANKGAYPQPDDNVKSVNGKIFLSGYDKNILKFGQDGEKYFEDLSKKSLSGKSLVNINGGSDVVIFNGNVNLENLKVNKYEPSLLATVCYEYNTVAGPSVCIDPDPYSIVQQKKVCQVNSITLTNQGAPIAITNIDEEAFATKTQFKITIKNVGQGEVIKSNKADSAQSSGSNGDTINKCDPFGTNKLAREDIDKVYAEEISIGQDRLLCYPFIDKPAKADQGFIRLLNGEGSIICEFEKTAPNSYPGGNTAYTTPLKIILSYVYKTTAQRSFLIQRENIGKN